MLRQYLLIGIACILFAGCAPTMKELGNQAFRLEEYQQAVEFYEKALEENPNPEVQNLLTKAQVALEDEYIGIATAKYKSHNLDEALDYYKKAAVVRNRAKLKSNVDGITSEIESIEKIAERARSIADTDIAKARTMFNPIKKYNIASGKVAETQSYLVNKEAENMVRVNLTQAGRSEKQGSYGKTDKIIKKTVKHIHSAGGLSPSDKKRLQKKVDLFKNTTLMRRSIKKNDAKSTEKFARLVLRLDKKNKEAKKALRKADTLKIENLIVEADKDMRNPHILSTDRMIRASEGYCAAAKLLGNGDEEVKQKCKKLRVAVSEKLTLASEKIIKQTTGVGFEAVIAFLYKAALSFDKDNKELILVAKDWKKRAVNRKKDNITFSPVVENCGNKEMKKIFLDLGKKAEKKHSHRNGFPLEVKIRFLHSSLQSSQPLDVNKVQSTYLASTKTSNSHTEYTFQKFKLKHTLNTKIDVIVESRETGIQQKCNVDEVQDMYVFGNKGVSAKDTKGYKRKQVQNPNYKKLSKLAQKGVRTCLDQTIVDVRGKADKVRRDRYGKFSELYSLDRKMMPKKQFNRLLPFAERRVFSKMFGVDYDLLRKQL